MIATKILKAMSAPELQVEIVRLKNVIKRCMGAHYPTIYGGEIGQLEAELTRRQKRKVIYVYWDEKTNAGYTWKLGYRRVYPGGKNSDGTSLPSEVIAAFFKKHKVSHIHSEFGESETSPECIKDGIHTVASYLKWWRSSEQED